MSNFERIKTNLIFFVKIIIFVMIILVLTQYIGNVCANKNEGYLYSDILYMTDDEEVDAVFIGSSHCYCTVIPQLIYDDMGGKTIVVADNMESTASSYWSLIEVSKKFPKSQIFVELYTATTEYDESMHHNYYTSAIRRMPQTSLIKYRALSDIYNKCKTINWQYYFRFFSARNSIFGLQRKDFFSANENRLRECKGYDPRFNVMEEASFECEELSETDKNNIELNQQNVDYIKKMIKYASKNNIRLTFFVSPYVTSSVEDYKFELIEEVIKEEDGTVEYINFNNSRETIGMDTNLYYKDNGHTNYWGAQIVTKCLEPYIKTNSNNTNNKLWEDYKKCYEKWEIYNDLVNVESVEQYFSVLENKQKDIIVMAVIQGDYNAFYNNIEAENMQQVYSFWGLQKESKERVILVAPWQKKYEKEIIKANIEDIPIILSNQGGMASLVIENKDLSKKVDGLNICVFDAKDMSLIDNIGIWNGSPTVILR